MKFENRARFEKFLRAFKINSIGIGERSTFRKRKELPQKSIEI